MRLPTKILRNVLSPGERKLSFGEHLEELRSVVLRCLLATILFAIVCLAFQDELIAVLRRPYDRMTVNVEKHRAEVEEEFAPLEKLVEAYESTRQRWDEIRSEIDRTSDTGEGISPTLRAALEHQQEQLAQIQQEILRMRADARKIRSIRPTTVFVSYLKVSIIAALFIASPYILLEIWVFVAAGLYPRERRYVLTFLPVSILLFILGILFGYFILVPIGLSFLGSYAGPDVLNAFTLDHYLSLCITLTLLLGVIFELPLVMVFVTRIGVMEPRDFARYRKYSLLFAVVLAAILTPPDPATQMLLAGPLVVLYEAGIWLGRLFGPQRRS